MTTRREERDADATRVEHVGDPRATRRESAGPNPTRRETADPNATRRESGTDANATRREGVRAASGSGVGVGDATGVSPHGNAMGAVRFRLPADLEVRFLALRDLPRGAQADVLVAEDRQTGREVVIKLYRQGGNPYDISTMTKLDSADRRHVVQIIERGSSDGHAWELQEYCAHGTLWQAITPGSRVSADQFTAVVRNLGDALAHLHELKIVHRDVKPANVLVRSLKPLDLVVTDFGLSKEVTMSRDIGSVAGTFAYMAPEAHQGTIGRAGDWWGLGVLCYELLAGRHFLADASGRSLNENIVRNAIATGDYDVARIGTDRQWLLLRGLLTRERGDRWGSAQVNEWLAGRSPVVVEPRVARARSVLHQPFAGGVVSSPEQLAARIRSNWDASHEELATGRNQALIGWLAGFPMGEDATKLLTAGRRPGPTLVALQGSLDPATPAEFRGVPLSGFRARIAAGLNGDEAARRWARALRQQGAMDGFAVLGDAPAAGAHARLERWTKEIDAALEVVAKGQKERVVKALLLVEPQLLAAALGDEQSLRARALSMIGATSDAGWASRVVEQARTREDIGALAVAMAAAPLARAERELKERQDAEAARQRAAAAAEAARVRANAEAQAEVERVAANRQGVEDRLREQWRRNLKRSIFTRLGVAAGWCLLAGVIHGVWFPAGGPPTDPAEALKAVALIYAPSALIAVLISLAVEAVLLRRDWGNGVLAIVGLFFGLQGTLGVPETFLPTSLPLYFVGGWSIALLVGWITARVGRRASGGRPLEAVQAKNLMSRAALRWQGFARLGGALAGGVGLTMWVFLMVPACGTPATVTMSNVLLSGLADLLVTWIPYYDPLGLGADAFRLAMFGLAGFLMAALARDFDRLATPLLWVCLLGAVLAGVAVMVAVPWILPVSLIAIVISFFTILMAEG